MHNAAYCYDFAVFVEKYGPLLCVSLPSGTSWAGTPAVDGIRTDWTFSGFQYRAERHTGVRRLDLTNEADLGIARGFWNRARYWAADNDKLMPLRLNPYAVEA